jgi:protein-tyrosine phosphatase
MASKVKRQQLLLTSPAFCLQTIEQHAEPDSSKLPINAAACAEMSEIRSGLFLGSWRDAQDAELLKGHGITHVLNVAKEVPTSMSELQALESTDFTHMTIPLMDCHSEDIAKHFSDAYKFISEARRASLRVLVHCRRGISRSPAIVVSYLMRDEGMTFDEAFRAVKDKRSVVSLNLAFQQLLQEYDPALDLESRARRLSTAESKTEEEEEVGESPP